MLCGKFVVRSGVFFFKQKPAYEIRPGDWSSDVCSSDRRFMNQNGIRTEKQPEIRDVFFESGYNDQ